MTGLRRCGRGPHTASHDDGPCAATRSGRREVLSHTRRRVQERQPSPRQAPNLSRFSFSAFQALDGRASVSARPLESPSSGPSASTGDGVSCLRRRRTTFVAWPRAGLQAPPLPRLGPLKRRRRLTVPGGRRISRSAGAHSRELGFGAVEIEEDAISGFRKTLGAVERKASSLILPKSFNEWRRLHHRHPGSRMRLSGTAQNATRVRSGPGSRFAWPGRREPRGSPPRKAPSRLPGARALPG